MSNFKCNKCGFINIDCGKDGYKTPKEINLEFKVKDLEETIKKLKTKEQECESLKERLRQCWTIENSLVEQIDQLKAENDELEKWKKEHLKDVEFIERNPVIDILCSMADNILLEQRNEKFKQALTEIKEIAEGRSNYPCGKCIKTEILQKIREVQND